MENNCPLCKRVKYLADWGTTIPYDFTEIESQIITLRSVLTDLLPEYGSILYLRQNTFEMCPMCLHLMDGVKRDIDTYLLREKITLQIEKLERLLFLSPIYSL